MTTAGEIASAPNGRETPTPVFNRNLFDFHPTQLADPSLLEQIRKMLNEGIRLACKTEERAART